MPNTLFLRLEAPLQSWGERAQWSERDTAPEPTKSGIVGLLACALGWNDDAQIRELSQSIRVGVRCDHVHSPTTLMDYHTVGGGYSAPQLLTGKGKPKFSKGAPHTEPTKRYYLSDASFLVAVQSASDRIAQLAQAVQSPVWPVFLGRKSCVPTRPIFDDVDDYDSLEEALRQHPARVIRTQPHSTLVKAVIECQATDEGSLRRHDEISLPSLRVFAPRYSREVLIKDVIVQDLLASKPLLSASQPPTSNPKP
jgi:CRISPR system Cascade subunit CasD